MVHTWKINTNNIIYYIRRRGVFVLALLGLCSTLVIWGFRREIKQGVKTIVWQGASMIYNIDFAVKHPSAQQLETIRSAVATGPLEVNPANRRYFTDGSGKAILLSGSHIWNNLQDSGSPNILPYQLNYSNWLSFLKANNHNYFILWSWEQARWVGESTADYRWLPSVYARTGPGNALDGELKFDLNQFNQAYFDRMRQRVIEAGNQGIYVNIVLFNGWSVDWKADWGGGATYVFNGHPFNKDNNINDINGDPLSTGQGNSTQDLSILAVTALQKAYIRKVIDTVNDLPNVLYEICIEGGTAQWQYHMVNYIHTYEAGKPYQHPVGMSHIGNDEALFNSPADFVSIFDSGDLNSPYISDGPKVVIVDTDHVCGICGNRAWVWKSFMHGKNMLFMDQYDDSYKWLGGGYNMNNPNDVNLRANLGYVMTYANRMNLVAMTPRGELASSGYALANPAASGAEYLVYLPNGGTVNVNISASSGQLLVEWFNPANGTVAGTDTTMGGAVRAFTAPFSGDAVLYIYATVPATQTPTPTRTKTPTIPVATRTNTPSGPTAPWTPTSTSTLNFSTLTPTSPLTFPTLTFTLPVESSLTPSVSGTVPATAVASTSTGTPIPPGSNSARTLLYCVVGILLSAAIVGVLFYLLWKFRQLNRPG